MAVPIEVPSLATVRERLAEHTHLRHQPDRAWAATALVLHDDPVTGPRVLFIERAQREGDRWSGHMALPGGKRDDADADLVETARRETAEEVALKLPGPPMGRLRDVGSRVRGGFVATYVWGIDEVGELVPEPSEVAAIVWIPLATIFDPAAASRLVFRGLGPFPAIRHDENVVWGLTHQTLQNFADVLGMGLPKARWR